MIYLVMLIMMLASSSLCIFSAFVVFLIIWRYITVPTLQHDSVRAQLLAVDGNTIDCMFVDQRGSPDITAKGNKLVICCEGNAAFYELGMMEIPLTCK